MAWTLGPNVPAHKRDRADGLTCRQCSCPPYARGLCPRHYAADRYARQRRDDPSRSIAAQDAYMAAQTPVRADGLLHSDYYRAWLASRRPGLPSRVYRASADLPVTTGRVIAVEEVVS